MDLVRELHAARTGSDKGEIVDMLSHVSDVLESNSASMVKLQELFDYLVDWLSHEDDGEVSQEILDSLTHSVFHPEFPSIDLKAFCDHMETSCDDEILINGLNMLSYRTDARSVEMMKRHAQSSSTKLRSLAEAALSHSRQIAGLEKA